MDSILKTSIFNFEAAADRLGLFGSIRQKVMNPRETITINLSPVLPSGEVTCIPAFVVRHNDILGPAKGGIRMTADVTLEDITGLAMEMSWKTSLIGVPFGGGKSGIQVDPATLSDDIKEVVVRSFTRGVGRHLGPELYVPAPDMGTNELDMAHIRDCIAYSQGTSITNGCFVTGKPVILGGIVGRREATGKGVFYTVQAVCEEIGLDLNKARVVVQGFGNVGSVAATEIVRHGATVVGVADISCGLINHDGIDVEALLKHSNENGSIKSFSGATEITTSEILEIECDILIPAAAGSQITINNVDRVKARIIAEGANSPTTPKADEVLNNRGTLVVPDILCNAGGVFVSYLEYTQETQREQMTLEAVENRLSERMRQRFSEVYETAKRDKSAMRDAAMNMALKRVLDGVYARGMFP